MIKNGLINGALTIQRECDKKCGASSYSDTTNYVLMSIVINMIERTKTIMYLTDKARYESIGILVRSFFELHVSLVFILEKETDLRAKSYYYYYKISVIEKFNSLGEINPEYTDLPKEAYDLLIDEAPGAMSIKDVLKHYKEKQNKLYDNPKHHSQKWFNLHGEKRRTFKNLMLSLGFREDLYLAIYGLGSNDIHGHGSLGSVKKSENKWYVDGTLPLDFCNNMVETYLIKSLEQLAKHYGILKKSKVSVALKQMGTSSSGGNFRL